MVKSDYELVALHTVTALGYEHLNINHSVE